MDKLKEYIIINTPGEGFYKPKLKTDTDDLTYLNQTLIRKRRLKTVSVVKEENSNQPVKKNYPIYIHF
jgi:hypothetical protein